MDENDTATAAERVFDIAELAEQILLHAEMRDVLRFQRLNKHTKALVAGSLALQRKLHLVAEPGNETKRWITSMPKHFELDGQCIIIDGPPLDQHADDDAAWRKMFLTQPPLKEALVRAKDHAFAIFVTNDGGITLGDVEEVAREMRREGHVEKFRLEFLWCRVLWGGSGRRRL